MTVRARWQAAVITLVFLAAPSMAGPLHGEHSLTKAATLPLIAVTDDIKREPDAIVFVRMTGTCSKVKVAGRDYKCRAVAFIQNVEGRANYSVALDDPNDGEHVISFSGDNGRRPKDNLYELPVDRMLIKNKDRPKADGLPIPSIELTSGLCRQVGSFAELKVSSISCSATDKGGKKYELEYQSDGKPVTVLRISQKPVGLPSVTPFDEEPK
jgi:hypothetical protein